MGEDESGEESSQGGMSWTDLNGREDIYEQEALDLYSI
jgi:hypothetical protein